MVRVVLSFLLLSTFFFPVGNPVSNFPQYPCENLDIVFVIGDSEAARAVEVLIHSLTFYQEKFCHSATLHVAVVDALSISSRVLQPLSPLPLQGESKSEFQVPLDDRPRYRSQWHDAFQQAFDMLRKADVAHRERVIFYMGGLAQDATASNAKRFIESELLPYLEKGVREQDVRLWIISGERDPEFRVEIGEIWREAYQKGILRGGMLPAQGYVQTPQGYIRLVVDTLQELGIGMNVQEVGCGEYQVPVLQALFITWLRLKEETSHWPAVTLKWESQGFVEEVQQPNFYLSAPPAGILQIQSPKCDELVGFAQVELPDVHILSPQEVLQDRGQPAPTYRLEALLVDEQGTPLSLAEPWPRLQAEVFDEQGERITTLAFTWEDGHLYSEPLPRKQPGLYRWEVSGSLPYRGIQAGTADFGGETWPLTTQTGEYRVVPVERMSLHVEIEGWQPGSPLLLHGSWRERLRVLPVVVRAWVIDEEGQRRDPEELFEDPNQALKLRLISLQQGQTEEVWMRVVADSWYGEVGQGLPWEGKYRLEIEKGKLAQSTFIWDTDDSWKQEVVRQDTFWHKPSTWKGIGVLGIGVFVFGFIAFVYNRTSPLRGSLVLRVEGMERPLQIIPLHEYRRRKVRLIPEHWGPEGIGVPILEVKNRKGEIEVRTKEGRTLYLRPGETQPLQDGLQVSYNLEEE